MADRDRPLTEQEITDLLRPRGGGGAVTAENVAEVIQYLDAEGQHWKASVVRNAWIITRLCQKVLDLEKPNS